MKCSLLSLTHGHPTVISLFSEALRRIGGLDKTLGWAAGRTALLQEVARSGRETGRWEEGKKWEECGAINLSGMRHFIGT